MFSTADCQVLRTPVLPFRLSLTVHVPECSDIISKRLLGSASYCLLSLSLSAFPLSEQVCRQHLFPGFPSHLHKFPAVWRGAGFRQQGQTPETRPPVL